MEENNQETKVEKKNNVSLYLIVTFVILLIGCIGYFVYAKYLEKNNSVPNDNTENNVSWSEEDYEEYEFIDEDNKVIDSNDLYLTKITENYLAITKIDEDSLTSTAYIFDVNKKKIILTEKDVIDDLYVYNFGSVGENNDYIALFNKCQASCSDHEVKIYTSDLKLISDSFDVITFDNSGNLRILENGGITTYDKKGKMISEDKKNSNIVFITGNYTIYIDNNQLMLALNDNGSEMILSNINKDAICGFDSYISENSKGVKSLTFGVIDKSVTVDDVWKNCTSDGSEECNGESKKSIKDFPLGYRYEYDIVTKKLDKFPDYFNWDSICGD